ncbi:MAG: methylated-DNA--[protein]-cysteine S-methyltransferase [Flavobacteriales bacterium]|nr:methylated-DNA--[protein]-cysteine S-methyltransferase [Flavobacteriales bacterium]
MKPTEHLYQSVVSTPVGVITLQANDHQVIAIHFGSLSGSKQSNDHIHHLENWLAEYFDGKDVEFDHPIGLEGTQFQQEVWELIRRIPRGYVTTYQSIANHLNKPTCARAVGQAVARNPLPIVIPCHRVLGKNGQLTGYIGGLAIKEKLLELEKASFQKQIIFPS